jgi:hypothetical protein
MTWNDGAYEGDRVSLWLGTCLQTRVALQEEILCTEGIGVAVDTREVMCPLFCVHFNFCQFGASVLLIFTLW